MCLGIKLNDDEKTSCKSVCGKPSAQYSQELHKENADYVCRLKFTENWGITIHKPDTQSIYFEGWRLGSICEYALNKILVNTIYDCMFIIHDFIVTKLIDGHNYKNMYKSVPQILPNFDE